MQWLPAIHWERTRWVLPLSVVAADSLAACLLSERDAAGRLTDPEAAAGSLLEGMRSDPALLLFAILETQAAEDTAGDGVAAAVDREIPEASDAFPAGSVSRVTGWQLAFWLAERLPRVFADHDRCLRTIQWIERWGAEGAEVDWRASLRESYRRSPADWPSWAGWWQFPRSAGGVVFESGIELSLEPADWERAELYYGRVAIDLYRLAAVSIDARELRTRFAGRLREEKLASLRQLAYGLSHEINNPLAAVRTRAERLTDAEPDSERRAGLSRIVDSVMRAHEMIADLMYFARPPQPVLEDCDADGLVAEVVAEYDDRCAERAIVLRIGAGRGGQLRADPHQLADALRALLDNALEAVGELGEITVQVAGDAERVEFAVSDSGPGLSDEARRHGFDPYFSGREAGRGLGLGLCRVYRIAHSHGGEAALDAPPVGCRAHFWVPRQTNTKAGAASGIRLD